jgi:hypothetical protein
MRRHQTAEAARNPPRSGDRAAGKSQTVTNDVEKRWRATHALRAAMAYAVAVVLLAAAAFAVYALGDRSQLGWAIATPGVPFGGALGAFVKTYRDWRSPHLADPAGRGSCSRTACPLWASWKLPERGPMDPGPPPSARAPQLTSTWSLR